MEVTFSVPYLTASPVRAGVYKLTFDGQAFYIGGTNSLRARFAKWRRDMFTGVFKNFQVKEAYEKCREVKMEIIEEIFDLTTLDARETFYINKFWGNPLFLNRSPSAKTNKGMKLTDWQIQEIKDRSIGTGQRVAKFDKENNIVCTYISIAEAIEKNSMCRSDIMRVFKYRGRTYKGFTYRRVGEDGIPIDPLPFPTKPRAKRGPMPEETKRKIAEGNRRRSASGLNELPPHTKAMVKKDNDGNIVEQFASFSQLAAKIGTDPGNLRKMLRKGRPGYYKGYFYFPAESL